MKKQTWKSIFDGKFNIKLAEGNMGPDQMESWDPMLRMALGKYYSGLVFGFHRDNITNYIDGMAFAWKRLGSKEQKYLASEFGYEMLAHLGSFVFRTLAMENNPMAMMLRSMRGVVGDGKHGSK